MIDQVLYKRALEVADQPVDEANILNIALRGFIAYQAQARLATMGGIAPDLPQIPRRRQDPEDPEDFRS